MGTRCRLCADCSEDLVPVLGELELPSRIFQLFQVRIDLEDRLPTVVCRMCFDTVNRTWEFTERVRRAQELLAECALSVQQDNEGAAAGRDDGKDAIVECMLSDSGMQAGNQSDGVDASDEKVKPARVKVSRLSTPLSFLGSNNQITRCDVSSCLTNTAHNLS